MSLSTWVSSAGQNSQNIIPLLCLQSLTLVSLAFKSNSTKSAPSDLRSSQSRTVASFCSSVSPMGFLGWSKAKVQLLLTSLAQGEDWWLWGSGILNRERRVWMWSWRSIFLSSLIHGVAVSKGVLSCFILMAFFFLHWHLLFWFLQLNFHWPFLCYSTLGAIFMTFLCNASIMFTCFIVAPFWAPR